MKERKTSVFVRIIGAVLVLVVGFVIGAFGYSTISFEQEKNQAAEISEQANVVTNRLAGFFADWQEFEALPNERSLAALYSSFGHVKQDVDVLLKSELPNNSAIGDSFRVFETGITKFLAEMQEFLDSGRNDPSEAFDTGKIAGFRESQHFDDVAESLGLLIVAAETKAAGRG